MASWILACVSELLHTSTVSTRALSLMRLFLAELNRGTKMRSSNLYLCHSCSSTPPCSCFSKTVPTPHTARVARAFLDQEHIQLLPWPAFIPDMSPTKNAWNLLGGHVHQRQPQSMTTAQLQYALIQDWRAILQQQSQTLVQTMCRQVNASITPRGGPKTHTKCLVYAYGNVVQT